MVDEALPVSPHGVQSTLEAWASTSDETTAGPPPSATTGRSGGTPASESIGAAAALRDGPYQRDAATIKPARSNEARDICPPSLDERTGPLCTACQADLLANLTPVRHGDHGVRRAWMYCTRAATATLRRQPRLQSSRSRLPAFA